MKQLLIAISAFALSVSDCSADKVPPPANEFPKEARATFEAATEFQLYSLNPSLKPDQTDKSERFHNWRILGKLTVTRDAAKKVRDAVEKGINDSDGSMPDCFNPRHGIRVVKGDKTFDLVICYQCHSVEVYEGEKKIGQVSTAPGQGAVLTKVLEEAKVPLPKREE